MLFIIDLMIPHNGMNSIKIITFGTSFFFSFQHNTAAKHSEFEGDRLNTCA